MSGKIAFQGELGAYGHEACVAARPDFTPLPCRTFVDAIEAVRKGDADYRWCFGVRAGRRHLRPRHRGAPYRRSRPQYDPFFGYGPRA